MDISLNRAVETSKEFKLLCEELAKNKISKTILLISKDEKYSFAFAKLLAASILNNGYAPDIEQSANYIRLNSQTHPDAKFYPKKEKLLVSDSEEIVEESFVKPILCDNKVFVISNFDLANESAQNKLLKTFEEPQKSVYFVITTTNENLVLPTIKSRCNIIRLKKIDKNVIKESFSEENDLLIELCDGNIGKILDYQQIPNLKEKFDSVLNCITKLKTSSQILEYSKAVADQNIEPLMILEWLTLIFEDLLAMKFNKKVKLESKKELYNNILGEFSVKSIIKIYKLIEKAAEELSYNGNFVIIFENLLLNILEVKYYASRDN